MTKDPTPAAPLPVHAPAQPASDVAPPPASGHLEPVPLDLQSPQLTLRAMLTGFVLAGLLSACNIYTGLKIGWSFNMSITAALLAYGGWTGVHELMRLAGGRPRRFGLLENNTSQTAASAGASVASAGLVAPIPALALLTGQQLDWASLSIWIFSVCLVGIVVAIGLRRQMLLVEKLPFVAGLATAETLRELYAEGREALRRVTALASSAAAAAVLYVVNQLAAVKAAVVGLHGAVFGFSIKGFSAGALTFGLDPTLLMYAVGGLVGIRACISLVLGAVLAFGVLAPTLIRSGHLRLEIAEPLPTLPAGVNLPPEPFGYARHDARRGELHWRGEMTAAEHAALLAQSSAADWQAAIENLYVRSQLDPQRIPAGAVVTSGRPPARPDFRSLVNWLLWPGVTLMVVASLVSFGFSWRSIVGSFTRRGGADHSLAKTQEVTRRWFLILLAVAFVLSLVLQVSIFKIIWWAAAIGILFSFLLALVAARVAGETNVTPVGAMGKVTQLLFGVLVPGQPAANLMAANVTGGAASQCAELLMDLKCGWLVGASPRIQVIAQIWGVVAGATLGSLVYMLLIPDPHEQLMTAEWAAPAVAAWKAVAEIFKVGIAALPAGTPLAMLIAALAAIALAVLEKTAPARLRLFVPSPASLGLAFVIQAYTSMTMFVGALVAMLLMRYCKSWAARYFMAVCAGIIAGESVTGVAMALRSVLGA